MRLPGLSTLSTTPMQHYTRCDSTSRHPNYSSRGLCRPCSLNRTRWPRVRLMIVTARYSIPGYREPDKDRFSWHSQHSSCTSHTVGICFVPAQPLNVVEHGLVRSRVAHPQHDYEAVADSPSWCVSLWCVCGGPYLPPPNTSASY